MELDQKINRMLVESALVAMASSSEALTLACESPIEELFALTMWARGVWTERVEMHHCHTLGSLVHYAKIDPSKMYFCAQVTIVGYRVDFVLVEAASGQDDPSVFAIECDGHDFHEKTKEQVRKDKARDRALVAAGCYVLRFSGSEIWANPVACVDQVLDLVAAKYHQSWERHSASIMKQFGSFEAFYKFYETRASGEVAE